MKKKFDVELDLWPSDFMVSARRDPAMDYMSTKFGVDSSSRWETDKQMKLNVLSPAGGYIAVAGMG